MEQEQKSIFNFSFDENSKEHIKTIGQWALINAILAFVGLILNIAQFTMLSRGLYRRATLLNFNLSPQNGFTLFIQALISILLNVFLYNASVHLKKGVDGMNNEMLGKGFGMLRTYYKIYGIILIVALVLIVLGLLFLNTFKRY